MAGEPARTSRAAPSADHLRDQSALHGGRGAGLAGRSRTPQARIDRPGGLRSPGPHGASGDRRQPFGQRRVEAALGTRQDAAGARLLSAVAREVQQQDQRRHPAAMAVDGESGSRQPARRDHRRRMGDRPRAARARSRNSRTTPSFSAASGRSSAPTRSAWRESSIGSPRSTSIPPRCSTYRPSASTNTSANS